MLLGLTVVVCGWFLVRFITEKSGGGGEVAGTLQPATPSPTPAPSPAATPEPSEPSPCDGEPPQTDVLKRIRARRKMIIGVQQDAPPMNGTDERNPGKRIGFDYELSLLIADHLNLIGPDRVVAKEVEFYEELFCFLKQKEGGRYSVDVIMSGIIPDETLSDIEWSIPYYDKFGYALIARESSPIEDIDDCKGLKIGVVEGDPAVDRFVKTNLENPEVVPLPDEDNWINAVNTGVVDAVIYDFPFAVEEVKLLNAEKRRSRKTADYLEIKKPYLEGSDLEYCIGIPKGNPDLKEKIDKAIGRIKGTPEYVGLVRKYFGSADIKEPERPADAKVYVIVEGDSLSNIAERELGDGRRWRELQTLNNIGNEHLILAGHELIMPADYRP